MNFALHQALEDKENISQVLAQIGMEFAQAAKATIEGVQDGSNTAYNKQESYKGWAEKATF